MAYTSYKGGYFPSQVVSDFEKITKEYGLKVAQAIENEWFGVIGILEELKIFLLQELPWVAVELYQKNLQMMLLHLKIKLKKNIIKKPDSRLSLIK